MHAFVVLGLVFSYQANLGLGSVSEMTYFVSSGTQNLNSVNLAEPFIVLSKHYQRTFF